ncbi:MAG TPA: hypothetical protein EYP30_02375 [Archaeoglobaceae archaeon]|nr:hypothetical protein [Archaeoglobaceae archaeon]
MKTEIIAHCINTTILNGDAFLSEMREIADKAFITAYQTFWDWADNSFSTETLVESSPYDCPLPFFQFLVASNGECSICCRDIHLKNSVGSISNQSVKEMWLSEKANQFRLDMLDRNKRKTYCTDCFANHYIEPHQLDLQIYRKKQWLVDRNI